MNLDCFDAVCKFLDVRSMVALAGTNQNIGFLTRAMDAFDQMIERLEDKYPNSRERRQAFAICETFASDDPDAFEEMFETIIQILLE